MELVFLGRVAKAVGLKGEVAVVPYSAAMENFVCGERIIVNPDKSPEMLTIESISRKAGGIRLGFFEIKHRNEAERLIGMEVAV